MIWRFFIHSKCHILWKILAAFMGTLAIATTSLLILALIMDIALLFIPD